MQLLTDGDPDLHRYVDEYFPAKKYPNRVVTVDIIHVLEKLWGAGTARYAEGSDELAAWVRVQEDRLYDDDAAAVIEELRMIHSVLGVLPLRALSPGRSSCAS